MQNVRFISNYQYFRSQYLPLELSSTHTLKEHTETLQTLYILCRFCMHCADSAYTLQMLHTLCKPSRLVHKCTLYILVTHSRLSMHSVDYQPSMHVHSADSFTLCGVCMHILNTVCRLSASNKYYATETAE